MHWQERDGIRWLESALPGARAVFSARLGGVSSAPYDTLNLSKRSGDEEASVLENRRRLAAALRRDPGRIATARQVHGTRLLSHSRADPRGSFTEPDGSAPEGDGHITSDRGVSMLVLVADCLPVALAGERGAAMLHCGWRGLAGGLLESGAREVGARAAAIGPGIGPCCYAVGEDVLARFEGIRGASAGGGRLDLFAAARSVLAGAGVDEVSCSELCTSCDPELFFSHRRDGARTGRQAGIVWLEEA